MRFVGGRFDLALKRKSRCSQSFSRFIHDQVKPQQPCSFGVAFDIDGVLIRGGTPIGGSPQALKRLYDNAGALRIPFLFLTNGGGVPESKRALELSKLLGIKILASQVLQGHSPFKELVRRFENDLIIACGKGEPDVVMSNYGFKNVLSMDEYASYFDNIDPLSHHKKWVVEKETNGSKHKEMDKNFHVPSERVQAVFVVSDPVDWSRDIQSPCFISSCSQSGGLVSFKLDDYSILDDSFSELKKYNMFFILVLCDILRTGGLPGTGTEHQPPLYFASDDLLYQVRDEIECDGQYSVNLNHYENDIDGNGGIVRRECSLVSPSKKNDVANIGVANNWGAVLRGGQHLAAFPAERLGMGAFRIALEGIYNSIHPSPLDYTSYGKPNPFVFKNAELTLKQLPLPSYHGYDATKNGDAGLRFFKTLYMIGDNPSVDIKGARQAGNPWFSILTRTGVFRGKKNHAEHPADLVVDTVADAVDYILKKEGVS
ncbi:hypothetical protein Sjap_013375 [Stephania japonica]|uniref:Uncharacterized protein n=1 Tax=Stephania japonica TaxID=461633 RepID=A0AAP0NYJ6_9MAGN